MSVAGNKLLALINRDNKTNLVEAQVTIGTPVANPDAGVARDTKVRVTAVPGKGFKAHVDVWYNRIDLSLLFKNVNANVALAVTDGMTTDALIPLINAKYGTDFEKEDFTDAQPLVVSDQFQTVTLTAKADNVAYVQSFAVRYGIEEVALDSVILVTTLTGFNYPNADTAKGQAAIYSFNLDGSTAPDDFWSTVAVGPVSASFVTPFNQAYRVDEDWVFDGAVAKDYNLGGAQVIYNGDTSAAPADQLINSTYNKVVLMQLSATLCSNFGGVLSVYYGGSKTAAVPAAPTNVAAG